MGSDGAAVRVDKEPRLYVFNVRGRAGRRAQGKESITLAHLPVNSMTVSRTILYVFGCYVQYCMTYERLYVTCVVHILDVSYIIDCGSLLNGIPLYRERVAT
jgi:hypothetical protein